jgi:ATP-dependent Lon protease
MAVSLVSLLTGRPVSRDVAMTGEITLRGGVLEIGGLKEKALAALRLGIKTVVIPADNTRDLSEFPDYLLKQIRFVPVRHLDEVLTVALAPKPRPTVTRRPLRPRAPHP